MLLHEGTLHSHWSDVADYEWLWKNFTPAEFASKGNGEFYWHRVTFDAIQRARDMLGCALYINSAHRDWLYNLAVRGVARSSHLFIALDVSTNGHNREDVYMALKASGFTSFGFYETFIHVDMRPGRMWYGGHDARAIWQSIIERLGA